METICKCCGEKIEFELKDVIGGHRALCGDSKDPRNFDKLMEGKFAKVCFTSAPYNANNKLYSFYRDNLKSKEYIDFNLKVVENVRRHLRGYLFWNLSYNRKSRWEFIEIFYRILKESRMEFLELILWDKLHGLPIISKNLLTRQHESILLAGDSDSIREDLELFYLGKNDRGAYFNKKTNKGITNLWKIGTNGTQTKEHQACYPIKLPIRALELMGEKNSIVIDPYLGLFTTILSAQSVGQWGYGIELSEVYFCAGLQRWIKQTGQTPVKICNINEPNSKPKSPKQKI
ncbi:MAG: site-specific DNA-methyltransferase [Candidatus Staskawiczbacteria bacterium]|jgi:DNA modification methylase